MYEPNSITNNKPSVLNNLEIPTGFPLSPGLLPLSPPPKSTNEKVVEAVVPLLSQLNTTPLSNEDKFERAHSQNREKLWSFLNTIVGNSNKTEFDRESCRSKLMTMIGVKRDSLEHRMIWLCEMTLTEQPFPSVFENPASPTVKVKVDSYNEFLDAFLFRLLSHLHWDVLQIPTDKLILQELLKTFPGLAKRNCQLRVLNNSKISFKIEFNFGGLADTITNLHATLRDTVDYKTPKINHGNIIITINSKLESFYLFRITPSLPSSKCWWDLKDSEQIHFLSETFSKCLFTPYEIYALFKDTPESKKQEHGAHLMRCQKAYNSMMNSDIDLLLPESSNVPTELSTFFEGSIYGAQMKLLKDNLPILCKILEPEFINNANEVQDVKAIISEYSSRFPEIFIHPKWKFLIDLFTGLTEKRVNASVDSLILKFLLNFMEDLNLRKQPRSNKFEVTVSSRTPLATQISLILMEKGFDGSNWDNSFIYNSIDLLRQLYLAKTEDKLSSQEEFKRLLQDSCFLQAKSQSSQIYKYTVPLKKIISICYSVRIINLDDIHDFSGKNTETATSTPNTITAQARPLVESNVESNPILNAPQELTSVPEQDPKETDDLTFDLDSILGQLVEAEKSQLAANKSYATYLEALGKLIFQDNKLLHDAIRLQLIQHRGIFACNVGDLCSTYQSKDDKAKNLQAFIITSKNYLKKVPGNSFTPLENALGFYLPSMLERSCAEISKTISSLPDDQILNLAKQLVGESTEKPKGDLSEEEAAQVAEAFLQLKWGELTWLTKKGLLGQAVGEPNTSLPCFLVAQNGQNIRLTPFTLNYDEKHYIKAISKGTSASKDLLKQYANVNPDRFANGSIDITPEEAIALKKAVLHKKFVMLQRLEFTLTEDDLKGCPPAVSEATNEPTDIADQNSSDDHPERIANPDKSDEEKLTRKKRPVDELDELLPPESKKRALAKSESSNIKTKKVRDAKETGKYKAIDKEARIIARAKSSSNNTNGDIPDYDNPFDSIKAHAEDLLGPIDNLDDYLAAISNRSISTICEKAANEAEKLKVLLEDKPLNYPILKVYRPMDSYSPKAAPLNPLLKNYQKTDLDKILHLVKLDLAPLLCYEMGLGKTIVYVSFVLQKIFDGIQGKHLIVVPKSLQKQITDEVKVFMTEAIFKAWKSLPETDLSFLCQRLTHALQSSEDIHWDDLKLALMMLPKMTDGEFKAKFKHQRKNLDALQREIPELLNLAASHLNNMEARCKNTPSDLEATMQQKEKLAAFNDSLTLNAKLQMLSECFAFNPGRDPTSPFLTDIPGIEILLQTYISDSILKTFDLKDLHSALQPNKAKIVICTYEHFKKLSQAGNIPSGIASLIFDEMQKLQKSKSDVSAVTSDGIKQIRRVNPKLNILGVTGTPLENDFSELWTHLALVNSEHFPKATFDALRKIADDAKSKLLLRDPQKALIAAFRVFGHLKAFRDVVCGSLVFRRSMKDRQIHEDWKGLVPTREDIIVPLHMDAATLQKCNQIIASSKKDAGGHLKMGHDFSKIILTPNLQGVKQFQLTDENIKALSEKIKNGTEEEFQAFVASSPLVKTLLAYPRFCHEVLSKKRFLGFCDSLVVGKLVNRAIKRHFGLFRNKNKDIPKQVRFFNGQHTKAKNGISKRDDMIHGFKSIGDYFRFLALTFKTGGVGFNLPETDIVVMLERVYNPAKEDQAIARALRIGHKNHVMVLWMCPQTFKQDHIECILDKKRTLFDILFGTHPSLKTHLQKCMDFLLKDIYNDKLNELKSKVKAQAEMKPYADLVEYLMSQIDEDDLTEFVERVMPKDLPLLPEEAILQINETMLPMEVIIPLMAPPLPPPTNPRPIENSATTTNTSTVPAPQQHRKRAHQSNTQDVTRSVRKPQDISFDQAGVNLVPPLDFDAAIILAHSIREMLIVPTKQTHIQIGNCVKQLLKEPKIRQEFLTNSLDPDDQELFAEVLKGRTRQNAKEYKSHCRIAIYELQGSKYVLREEKNPGSQVNLRLVRLPNNAGYQVLLKKP